MIDYLYQFLQIMGSFLNKIFNLNVFYSTDVYLDYGFVLLYFAFAGILVNFIFGIVRNRSND